MEEVTEGLLRTIFRVLRWVLVDVAIEFVGFYLGKYTLLLLTLGKYPNQIQASKHEGRITLLGIVVLVAVGLGLMLLMDLYA